MLQEKRFIEPIAHIGTALPTKFGLPRQSGLVPSLRARIVFEPKYRDPVAFRGWRDIPTSGSYGAFRKTSGTAGPPR